MKLRRLSIDQANRVRPRAKISYFGMVYPAAVNLLPAPAIVITTPVEPGFLML